MSRKKSQPKKEIIPDPKFNSTIIPKLINNIMVVEKYNQLSLYLMPNMEKGFA